MPRISFEFCWNAQKMILMMRSVEFFSGKIGRKNRIFVWHGFFSWFLISHSQCGQNFHFGRRSSDVTEIRSGFTARIQPVLQRTGHGDNNRVRICGRSLHNCHNRAFFFVFPVQLFRKTREIRIISGFNVIEIGFAMTCRWDYRHNANVLSGSFPAMIISLVIGFRRSTGNRMHLCHLNLFTSAWADTRSGYSCCSRGGLQHLWNRSRFYHRMVTYMRFVAWRSAVIHRMKHCIPAKKIEFQSK